MTIFYTSSYRKAEKKIHREVGADFGLIFGSKYRRCEKCWEDIFPGMESEIPGVCSTCCAVLDLPRFIEHNPEVKK
jgi:hypothetical protein